jgi:LuxR family maltose regulon positive regulatory protein
MAKLDSVVRHAITAPAFDQTKLHRERLVDEIHANIPRKLIAVVAPPGYGKTTLLADFSEHTDLPVCWVRISEADRDVFRFAGMLIASLERRFRRLKDQIDLDSLSGSTPQALARTFAEVIDARVSEAFAIILDDVHLINNSDPTRSFLDELLAVLPEQATIVAAGREVIEVSLARLMADGDLSGIGPPDLALTQAEIIKLAELQSGFNLTEAHATRLLEETKGWVTGLLLSGELAGGDLPSLVFDARPMVYEYLASVVLNRQPEDMRRFLLDSAVFPVMTVEACNEVLQREDSQRYLTRLVRAGLFVSATNETPRTYEYHPQFREFLIESLDSADPKRMQMLRKSAAAYLAKHELPEQAIDLYLEAGEGGKAAQIAEKYAQEMFYRGRVGTLEDWQLRLRNAGEKVPRLLLYLTLHYTDRGDITAAESAYKQALNDLRRPKQKNLLLTAAMVQGYIGKLKSDKKEVEQAVRKFEKISSNRTGRLLKAGQQRLKAWLSAFSDHNLQAAEGYMQKAVKTLEKTDFTYSLVVALQDLSNIQILQGKTLESHITNQKAHDILNSLGAPLPLALSFNNLGYHAHLSGNYQDALELLNEGLKFARQAASSYHEALVLLSQADLFSDLNLALQSAELFGQGLMIATEIDHVELIRYGCLQTSVLHRRRGSTALAHDWLSRAMTLVEDGKTAPEVQIQLSALECGVRPEHVVSTLEKQLEASNLDAIQHTLGLFFLGKAQLASGELQSARKVFEETLTWAGANGMEQVLAAELEFDEDVMDFMRAQLQGNPVLSVVFRRIDTMRAIAQQYQMAEDGEAPSDTVRIMSLGKVELQNTKSDINSLKPLAREVLFFLVDNQPVERDVLLETFWPHYPPGRQVANLHTAIYSLRRLLGKEMIEHEGSSYALNGEWRVEYDVERFERTARVAEGLPLGDPRRMFALTEAINSYSGPFLPEFDSDWVAERRRELELRYLDLLGQHAQEALVRDQPSRALRTLRQALELDPLRDDTNLRYLEALGRLGRRSELVEHYQQYTRMLSIELGLDPPETVRELYTRLIS